MHDVGRLDKACTAKPSRTQQGVKPYTNPTQDPVLWKQITREVSRLAIGLTGEAGCGEACEKEVPIREGQVALLEQVSRSNALRGIRFEYRVLHQGGR